MYAGAGPAGSAVITYSLTSYFINGNCEPVGPGAPEREQGADGIPCTADDPHRLPPGDFVATTGMATTRVVHVNNTPASTERTTGPGNAVNCGLLASDPNGGLEGATLNGALPQLHGDPNVDLITTFVLACEASTEPTATATPVVVPTLTPTPAAQGTATSTRVATATPLPGVCVGDCDGDFAVTSEEVLTCQNISLFNLPLSECPSCDGDGDESVTTAEVVQAQQNTRNGCPGAPTPTLTVTPSEFETPTATSGITPTPTSSPACLGDCNGDGVVTVDELITGVNIALGALELDACEEFDGNADGTVTVDELITAVNNALTGCV
jgi:hypothetical protein